MAGGTTITSITTIIIIINPANDTHLIVRLPRKTSSRSGLVVWTDMDWRVEALGLVWILHDFYILTLNH